MRKFFAGFLKLTWCVMIFAVCCCIVPMAATAAASDDQDTQTAGEQYKNLIEDEAVQALYTMSSYLRTLTAFEMKADFFLDEVLVTGQKVLISGESTTLVRLPNKYLAKVKIDEKKKDFEVYFDGQNFTLYGKNNQFYVTSPAPGTVGDLVLKTFAEKGIELPLQDIFLWGTSPADKKALQSAFSVGSTTIDSKPCTHYAYRQDGVDWQVWMTNAETPLPLQVVITTTSDVAQPQYSARISWDLNPSVSDDLFAFTPPKGACAIDFMPAENAAAQ
nr:DUF2092 domain-containing protein [uncultured Desulfobacter sp.]